MIIQDVKTGKKYVNNIPDGAITAIETPTGKKYKIIAQNHNHLEYSWYNGRFIGDCYAVLLYVKPEKGCGFWQQVSPWYYRFGNASRKMFQLSKME